jgi:ornithine decarboxylase
MEAAAYSSGIKEAAKLFAHAREIGLNPNVLDIGGGYTDQTFQNIGAAVRTTIAECFPNFKEKGDLRILAEPGTLFSCSPFYLAVKVIGRRKNATAFGQEPPTRIYINDGIYSNFMMRFIVNMTFKPIAVIREGIWQEQKADSGDFKCSVWGRSCDSNDCINRECMLDREIDIGDWLVFGDMGGKALSQSILVIFGKVRRSKADGDMVAYTTVCDTTFNVSTYP